MPFSGRFTKCLARCGIAGIVLAMGVVSSQAVNPAVYRKVLFVGDSITYHQTAPSLDWSGTWGMAATAEDKDYVHVFLKTLSDGQKTAPDHLVMAKGGGTLAGQLAMRQQMTDYHADLAVVQLGENDRDISDAGFQKPYAGILAAIRAGNPEVKILCLGVWGPPGGGTAQDTMIREACKANRATFVGISDINADLQAQAKSTGLYTNAGVQWHPSDYGMAKYAAALWNALSHDEQAQAEAPATSIDTDAKTILDEKWNPNALASWTPAAPSIVRTDNVQAAKFVTAKTGDSNKIQTVLIPAEIAGKWVTVQTRVKGNGISPRPNSYNGAKVIFHLRSAEGADEYPQVNWLPDGTFDWKEIQWRLRIPDNTVSAEFTIGLENVQGTLWVAPISIKARN